MAKTKDATAPDTHVLLALLEEYREMLREADRGVKKVLTLNPQSEKFWDELASVASNISQVGDRSNSIWKEIVDLIEQLPED